jgi:hypothetical protein
MVYSPIGNRGPKDTITACVNHTSSTKNFSGRTVKDNGPQDGPERPLVHLTLFFAVTKMDTQARLGSPEETESIGA